MAYRASVAGLTAISLAAALAACGGSSGDSGSSASTANAGSSFFPAANAQTVTDPNNPVLVDPKEVEQAILNAGGAGVTKGGGGGAGYSTAATKSTGAATRKSLTGGWNFIQVAYCMGTYVSGYYFVYVVGRDGSYSWTADPAAIAMLAPACTVGPVVGFYVTSYNGYTYNWTSLSVSHL